MKRTYQIKDPLNLYFDNLIEQKTREKEIDLIFQNRIRLGSKKLDHFLDLVLLFFKRRRVRTWVSI